MIAFEWSRLAVVFGFSALAVAVVLGTTMIVAFRIGRHAIVDVAWGLGFTGIAVAAALTGGGDDTRRWLVLALTAVWGVRLATHIYLRSRGKGEDPRYERLMSKAGDHPALFAVRKIYATQAVVMLFVSLPVQVAMVQHAGPSWVVWVGVAVWAVGIVFESVGDWQLTRFRNDPDSTGKVLDTGLWRYTRHPNYFGDACVWWGIWIVAASAWPGVLFVLSPIAMTVNLVSGTGAKLLEKGMGKRRPEYVDYVQRTSGFFPLPPKRRADD